MKSAAVYARYSSYKQSETSIEDQIALCREFAARNAFEIVSIYSDAAKSGSSLFGRSGLLSLLADAQNRAFEAVLVENLDRISRDQEDIAGVYKRLSFSGVEITQVHGGKADKMQVWLRGLLGSIYLQDLADKTHRGLSGRVAAGKSAGGKAYGYRPVRGEPGELARRKPKSYAECIVSLSQENRLVRLPMTSIGIKCLPQGEQPGGNRRSMA